MRVRVDAALITVDCGEVTCRFGVGTAIGSAYLLVSLVLIVTRSSAFVVFVVVELSDCG